MNNNLLLSLKLLLKNGFHFGHNVSRYNPNNKPYIFGIRNNTYIFNLEKTFQQLKRVVAFLEKNSFQKDTILFVGTKKHVHFLTKLIAKKCNQLYIDTKWTPGILTNNSQLNTFLNNLHDLESKIINKETLSPKELAIYKKLKHKYKGLMTDNTTQFGKLPQLIVVLNPDDKDGIMAINEASQVLIPTIALVDSDASPLNITYPIPGNNNSIETISMFGNLVINSLNKKQNKNV